MSRKLVKPSLLVKAEQKHRPFICSLPLTGGSPCLDFVNTIDWRLDPDRHRDALIDYSDMLAFAERIRLIDDARRRHLANRAARQPQAAGKAVAEARAFRDALAALLDDIAGTPGRPAASRPRETALMVFEAARRRAHDSENPSWQDGRLHYIPDPEVEGFDAPWLALVRDAERLLRSPRIARVRVCEAAGCGRVFLDLSKNGTRRWCSMRLCGNREKARRFNAKA